jgi:hypothetical protein
MRRVEEDREGEGGKRICKPPSSLKIRQIGYSICQLIKKLGSCPRSSKAVFVKPFKRSRLGVDSFRTFSFYDYHFRSTNRRHLFLFIEVIFLPPNLVI